MGNEQALRTRLLGEVEQAWGQPIRTPKDFEQLSQAIFERLRTYVSPTTLKRLWGYLPERVQPRQGTLDILAGFVGFSDYARFASSVGQGEELQSAPVLSRRLNVAEALRPGDRLRLTWRPDRVCEVRYEGDLRFTVEASVNTRLQPGDRFQCALLIEGEPLYLDQLCQGTHPPVGYVCGKRDGIRFERME